MDGLIIEELGKGFDWAEMRVRESSGDGIAAEGERVTALWELKGGVQGFEGGGVVGHVIAQGAEGFGRNRLAAFGELELRAFGVSEIVGVDDAEGGVARGRDGGIPGVQVFDGDGETSRAELSDFGFEATGAEGEDGDECEQSEQREGRRGEQKEFALAWVLWWHVRWWLDRAGGIRSLN